MIKSRGKNCNVNIYCGFIFFLLPLLIHLPGKIYWKWAFIKLSLYFIADISLLPFSYLITKEIRIFLFFITSIWFISLTIFYLLSLSIFFWLKTSFSLKNYKLSEWDGWKIYSLQPCQANNIFYLKNISLYLKSVIPLVQIIAMLSRIHI